MYCLIFLNTVYKLLTYDLLRFVSYVLDVRDDERGLLIFLYRIVDIMIFVTKQMEAAEANIYRGGMV